LNQNYIINNVGHISENYNYLKHTTHGAIVIEGHVQGLSLARSLGEIGVPVYVVDKNNCIARYSRYTKKFFFCPDYKDDAFADFLIDLAIKEGIQGWVLLPSNDHAVITLSRNKDRIWPYLRMLVPEYDKIELIYDKVKLINAATELEIPVPDTYCFTKPEDDHAQMRFPVITKGKHGLNFYRALKTKAFIAETNNELLKQLTFIQSAYDLSDTFTQTIIESNPYNKTISFTAFSVHGVIKTHWIGVKLREHPIKFGTATMAESIKEDALLPLAEKLLKHLNYTGVCEIEFLKDPIDGKFKLIELNARTWLWVGLAKACGVNYAVYLYNYLINRKNEYPESYVVGLKWRNELTDMVFSFIALQKRLFSFKTYFEQSAGNKVSAIRYPKDSKPVLAYFLFLFSFLRKR
jgi:D-aspartate ligase